MSAQDHGGAQEGGGMEASERLRQYCINDGRLLIDGRPPTSALDPRELALVRIAALIATRAPGACFQPAIDDAVATGVSIDEIVAVLETCGSIAGLAMAVAASQQIAAALGLAEDLVAETEP